MKKVIVASKNPVKINTTQIAFARMFSDVFSFEGISVESGVSDQPMSDKETLQGAENRAQNARKAQPDADFWVGLEGGLEEIDGEMESFAWIVVISRDGVMGKARTASFVQPHQVAELIKTGLELGDADDKVFGVKNSKQANGSVGILTGDVITRTTYYEQAVILALIPFKNRDLY